MRRFLVFSAATALLGCGGGGGGGTSAPKLDDFLPALPNPDGTARSVYAGAITQENAHELIAGPAKSGLVGDFFMRNGRARFVIQSAARVIGIVPYGGNVVDAALLDAELKDVAPDHLGEIGMVYLLGRTCAHSRVEVLLDGAGGGPAVIRATGKSAVNDYVNLKGLGYLNIPQEIDPDIGDSIECATTYTLEPGSPTLKIAWTLFNPGPDAIQGPAGMLNDTGGQIQVFGPALGFSHLQAGYEVLLQGDAPTAVPYDVYQGPGVAYGVVPRLDDPKKTASGLVVAGASVIIFGASTFFDVTDRSKDYLHLAVGGGTTLAADLVVGRDGGDVDAAYRGGRGEATTEVAGRVVGATAGGARVGVLQDVDGDGQIGEKDTILTYFDADAAGGFTGRLPPGSYLLRADVPDVSRSDVQAITVAAAKVDVPALTLPDPARFDYTVVDDDDANGKPIPVKVTVVGRHPFPLDKRFTQVFERRPGVVRKLYAVHGTSAAPGQDPSDAPLLLPAGGPYKVFFTHGPEWSVGSFSIAQAAAGQRVAIPTIRLKRLVDTSGYVATAFHEHSMGSPDSPVGFEDRAKSLAVEGTEVFAGTDHDHLTDYAPIIAALGLAGWIESVVGIEATPFAYGHFNAYPMDIDDSDPSGGAVDWAQGQGGFAMLPSEIWQGLRDRGAKVVQVCHPRSPGLGSFQGYFKRAGLAFDFEHRMFGGDPALQEVPLKWLRLPEDGAIFSDKFDALETWINFGVADSDGDGYPELYVTDQVLRDWMNFLSMGKVYTPLGNGDTHTLEKDAAGMPRTLVRVPDDSFAAIKAGVAGDVLETISGERARDVVVTDGPMLRVTVRGQAESAIGHIVAVAPGEPLQLDIVASSADWVDFDTVEIFANDTFDPPKSIRDPTSLSPLVCFTSRPVSSLAATDPCKLAPLGGAQALDVKLVPVGNFQRREARVGVALAAADIPARAGKTGDDAWVVVRVRGKRALFPLLLDDAVDDANLDTLVTGSDEAAHATLVGRGAPAMAFTGAIFVDFDGGGWRAPFAP